MGVWVTVGLVVVAVWATSWFWWSWVVSPMHAAWCRRRWERKQSLREETTLIIPWPLRDPRGRGGRWWKR